MFLSAELPLMRADFSPPPARPVPAKVRRSRPEAVADSIKTWMAQQELKPGARLPGETELIEHFRMAKGTIREAMRILETQGLIRTRTGPGGGSFVNQVCRERAKMLLGNYFYFHHVTIADIYEARMLIEPQLVADLAGTLSPSTLSELSAIVDQNTRRPVTPDEIRHTFQEALRFHRVLAREAQNPVIGFMLDFLNGMLAETVDWGTSNAWLDEQTWNTSRTLHLKLLDALRRGRAEDARALTSIYLGGVRKALRGNDRPISSRFLSAN